MAAQSLAELNDELQAAVDLELGHPRSRVDAVTQAVRDRRAVHAIAEALCEPQWDSVLLEEIVQLIRDTGRTVGPPPLALYRG